MKKLVLVIGVTLLPSLAFAQDPFQQQLDSASSNANSNIYVMRIIALQEHENVLRLTKRVDELEKQIKPPAEKPPAEPPAK